MFDLKQTSRDLDTFSIQFTAFVAKIPDDAWQEQTGTREKDWTLHQTLAHLISFSEFLNQAVEAGINHLPFEVDRAEKRTDLHTWNKREIQALLEIKPRDLLARFEAALLGASMLAGKLSELHALDTVALFPYNRPVRLRDALDMQLSHAGIIHAVQLTFPLQNQAPLWTFFTEDDLVRMVDRFLRHISYSYWQEFGIEEPIVLNYVIDGIGEWHMVASPDGGITRAGSANDAQYTLKFTDTDTLFGIFTVHIPIPQAIETGALQITGDTTSLIDLLKLFSHSAPTQKA